MRKEYIKRLEEEIQRLKDNVIGLGTEEQDDIKEKIKEYEQEINKYKQEIIELNNRNKVIAISSPEFIENEIKKSEVSTKSPYSRDFLEKKLKEINENLKTELTNNQRTKINKEREEIIKQLKEMGEKQDITQDYSKILDDKIKDVLDNKEGDVTLFLELEKVKDEYNKTKEHPYTIAER